MGTCADSKRRKTTSVIMQRMQGASAGIITLNPQGSPASGESHRHIHMGLDAQRV